MEDRTTKSAAKTTSKDLLSVNGDGSSRAVVESLFRKREAPPGDKPNTFKVARSPLFDQLQSFLPKFERSNNQLLTMPPEERDTLNMENTDADDKVVEMNIVVGEMDDEHEEESDTTDSDTLDDDDDTPSFGHVTEHNMKIPSAATGGRKNSKQLIEEVSSEESGRSDGESTGESSASGER